QISDQPPVSPHPEPEVSEPAKFRPASRGWVYLAAGGVLGMLLSALGARMVTSKKNVEILPWSALLQQGRRLQIVTADTEISKMQSFGGYNLSLSEYANHVYRPAGISVPADMKGLLDTFRGQSIGATDVAISLTISQRAFAAAQQVSILPAR